VFKNAGSKLAYIVTEMKSVSALKQKGGESTDQLGPLEGAIITVNSQPVDSQQLYLGGPKWGKSLSMCILYYSFYSGSAQVNPAYRNKST
jgi:hypothetical protein